MTKKSAAEYTPISTSSSSTTTTVTTSSTTTSILSSHRRDATMRACLVLFTILGIPLFMIWWQVSAFSPGNGIHVGSNNAELAGLPSPEKPQPPPEEDTLDAMIMDHGKTTNKDTSSNNLDLLSDAVQITTTTTASSSSTTKKSNKGNHTTNDNNNNNNNNNSKATTSTATTVKSRPSMVWLMSFPNSGTSYTMRMVASATNRAVATNYGPEFITKASHFNVPLYEPADDTHFEGPFYKAHKDDDDKGGDPFRPLPDHLILTKTHCGGRCVRCPPHSYVLSLSQFIHACTETNGCAPVKHNNSNNSSATNTTTTGNCEWTDTHYPPPPHNPHIAKLIHLVRDPFTNIVSRFHLARKLWTQRLQNKPKELQKWLDRHPSNATGFNTWCEETDQEYGSPFDLVNQKNTNTNKSKEKTFIQPTNLNCKAEWFRYVQWHSLALATIQQSQLPSLTIRYEDYEHNWNATVEKIMDFLEVPRPLEGQESIQEFQSRPPYDYYTQQQRDEARTVVRQLASDSVWEFLEPYFSF